MKKLMLGLVAAFAFGAVAAPVFADDAAGGDKGGEKKAEKKKIADNNDKIIVEDTVITKNLD